MLDTLISGPILAVIRKKIQPERIPSFGTEETKIKDDIQISKKKQFSKTSNFRSDRVESTVSTRFPSFFCESFCKLFSLLFLPAELLLLLFCIAFTHFFAAEFLQPKYFTSSQCMV